MNSDQRENFLRLLSKLTDREISAEEEARLESFLTDDSEAQLLYMQHVDIQVELACLQRSDQENAKVTPLPISPPVATDPQAAGFRYKWLAVAAVIIAAALALFWPRGSDRVIAHLDHIRGDVLIVPKSGLPWTPEAKVEIRSSYTLKVRGDGSSAVLIYPDKTLVALVGDTEIHLTDSSFKDLTLAHGVIAANVTPQPTGEAMRIATPGAELEVLGTEFTLESDTTNTHLAVLEGAVAFTREADAQRVKVTAGKVATVGQPPTPGEPSPALIAEPQQAPPRKWNVDFETPDLNWKAGQRTSSELPPRSKGAVTAERKVRDNKVYHQIEAPTAFVKGLFEITPTSHLHLTYKMAKPNWINIFLGVRSPELQNAKWELFKDTSITAANSPANRWQTITIPLNAFIDSNSREDSIIGWVPTGMLISSTSDPRGLTIDAIWVTGSGPGRVTVTPLNAP